MLESLPARDLFCAMLEVLVEPCARRRLLALFTQLRERLIAPGILLVPIVQPDANLKQRDTHILRLLFLFLLRLLLRVPLILGGLLLLRVRGWQE